VIRCSERFRTITTLAGAFVLAAGAVFIGGAGLAACGDDIGKAPTVEVSDGGACIYWDNGRIAAVPCEDGQ
jgi:hypothetical protein